MAGSEIPIPTDAVLHTGISVVSPEHRLQIDKGSVDIYSPQLIKDALARIRHKDTPMEEFRHYSDLVFRMQGQRLAETLPTRTVSVETPVGTLTTETSDSSGVLIIGILRSGYPAAQGIRTAMPAATIGVVDIKRDEETTQPSMFYDGIEGLDLGNFNRVVIPDPMLATGGSASLAINLLKERGARNIDLVSLVAAPEGVIRIQDDHPDVSITTAALDERLNDRSYIVPGLGDFGDRYFGTESTDIVDEIRGKTLHYEGGRLYVPSQGESLL
jgi:uracil phosphoribosyltransferase